MKLTLEINSKSYAIDLDAGRSIAIPLDFNGPQPNHFGVQRATTKTVEVGDFVGDTDRGGSCNVDQLSLIPHCNGTHTESVGHIVGETIAIGQLIPECWFVAKLLSVRPVNARETSESYRPELEHHDRVVTAESLAKAACRHDCPEVSSLIIRTLPNSNVKKSIAYGQVDHPAFLTVEAMRWVIDEGFEHLLLDLPSVDKMYDEGLLTNHHLFWNVPEGTHQLTEQTTREKTITEMVFVEDDIPDGIYLLNLQIPALVSDAAPSRPVLFPLNT